MKKVLAFSGSMSEESINHKLILHASDKFSQTELQVIRLPAYSAPIYTKELEIEGGVPEPIHRLRKLFDEADGFVLSSPEYNGSIPAGLKNTLDWISRLEGSIFQNKPVLLMATSNGKRGGKSVLDHLSRVLPFWGAKLIGPFSLPQFSENFNDSGLNEPFETELKELIAEFEQAVLDS